MQTNDSLAAVENAMRQTSAARAGFLGRDERSLAAIIRADDDAVRRRGLTHAQIARRLLDLRRAGWEGQGEPVALPPHFEVSVEAARGALPCPFGDQGAIAKVNTTVRDLARGRQITFSDLNIHMIEAHGFYEGRGAPFRLDPGQLAETLALGARQDA